MTCGPWVHFKFFQFVWCLMGNSMRGCIKSSRDDKNNLTRCIWTIPESEAPRFKKVAFKAYVESPRFKSQRDLEWHLKAYPNGCGTSGFCALYLRLVSIPSTFKSIVCHYVLRCRESMTSYQNIQRYDKAAGRGWLTESLLSSELWAFSSISFECRIRILEIEDKGGSVCYQHPLRISAVPRTQTVRWRVSKDLMLMFQTANECKPFCPRTEGAKDEMFSMQCNPNGWIIKNKVALYLKLCALPTDVVSVKVALTMKCLQMDAEWTSTKEFGYDGSRGWGCSSLFPSDLLSKHSEIDFVAEVEMLEYVDRDGSRHRSWPYHQIKKCSFFYFEDEANALNVGSEKGLALIVCIADYETASTMKNLPGTLEDRESLTDLFENEYKYETICSRQGVVCEDDFDELLTKARYRLHRDSKDFDVFILAFSGHGCQDALFLSDGTSYDRVDLYKFFDGKNCKPFTKKPKLFVIDACKGDHAAPRIKVESKGTATTHTHPDGNIVVLNANSDGYASYDHLKGGALIQSFKTVWMENEDKMSLNDMLMDINHRMDEIGYARSVWP